MLLKVLDNHPCHPHKRSDIFRSKLRVHHFHNAVHLMHEVLVHEQVLVELLVLSCYKGVSELLQYLVQACRCYLFGSWDLNIAFFPKGVGVDDANGLCSVLLLDQPRAAPDFGTVFDDFLGIPPHAIELIFALQNIVVLDHQGIFELLLATFQLSAAQRGENKGIGLTQSL